MSKKRRERIYFDNFLKAVGWPCAPSDVAEGESPDFVVTLRRRAVGVELVQVFADQNQKKSRMREDESVRLRWLSDLARDYYDSGGPPALVRLQFQPSYFDRIRGKVPAELRTKILERLLARVRRMEAGAHLTSRIRGQHQSLLATLWISALPGPVGRYSRWRLANDGIGWARWLSPDHVASLIAKKASLLPEYQRRTSDVVLVIVADKFLMSGMIIWDGDRLPARGFEAVYLLHYPEAKVDRVA